MHWVIEGKGERGRDEERVQAKRKAAESLVRRLVADNHFADHAWGYLIDCWRRLPRRAGR